VGSSSLEKTEESRELKKANNETRDKFALSGSRISDRKNITSNQWRGGKEDKIRNVPLATKPPRKEMTQHSGKRESKKTRRKKNDEWEMLVRRVSE